MPELLLGHREILARLDQMGRIRAPQGVELRGSAARLLAAFRFPFITIVTRSLPFRYRESVADCPATTTPTWGNRTARLCPRFQHVTPASFIRREFTWPDAIVLASLCRSPSDTCLRRRLIPAA
jgi:hypothetical protein